MLERVVKLSKIFKNTLNKRADALESLPDADSSGLDFSDKLKFAEQAVIDDLNNISSTYYAYENQATQAQRDATHQKWLLVITKEIQKLINHIKSTGYTNMVDLQSDIKEIRHNAANLSKQIGMRISLAELRSLRVLNALIEEEIIKSVKNPMLDVPYESSPSSGETRVFNKPQLMSKETAPKSEIVPVSDTLNSPGANV